MAPNTIPAASVESLTPERLEEIKDLLRYESSISFHIARAKESMLLMVAEVERLWAERETVERDVRWGIAEDFSRFGRKHESFSWGEAHLIAREGLCVCRGGSKPCADGGVR